MLEPRRTETTIPSNLLDLPSFNDDNTEFGDEAEEAAPRPWWRQPRWVAVVAAVLIVALLVSVPLVARAFRAPVVTYTTAQATQGNLIVTVSATGPVQSAVYNVNFSGSGKLAEIDVKVGQTVTAGQTLAKLDKTSLQDALNQAQAQVNSAQTSLDNAYSNQDNVQAQTQAQLNTASLQEQQAITACNGKPDQATCVSVAQAQYNSTVASVNASRAAAQSQINSTQSQLNAAETSLQTAQHNLSNATLTAPHAGTIASVNGTVGGTPGVSTTTGSNGSSGSSSSGSSGTFIVILDLSTLQVLANINEADIGSIAVNQPVRFTVSAYSTRRFSGTVSSISPLGQSTSNVVTYPVTIDVDPQSLQGATLLPSMTANVTVTTAQHSGVVLVPASAVTFARQALNSASPVVTRQQVLAALRQARQMASSLGGGTGSGGAGSGGVGATSGAVPAYVLERSSGGSWTVKPVVLGLTNGTQYEVLAGLSSGESVVTAQQGGATSTSTSTRGTGAGGIFGGGGGGGGRGGNGGGNGGG